MANDDIDVTIRLFNHLSAEGKAVTHTLEKAKRGGEELDVVLDRVEKRLKKVARASTEAAVGLSATDRELTKMERDAIKAHAALFLLDKKLTKMTRPKGGLFAFLDFGRMFKALKWGTIIGVISNALGVLAQMLTSVGAGAFAAVAGLAPLSGLIVAFPGILGAFVQGMGFAKIATMGLQTAITDLLTPNMNPTQLALDMSKLSPAGAKFAYAVAGLRPQLSGMTKDLQQRVLPSFSSLLDMFKSNYIGIFHSGMVKTGNAIGGVVGKLTQFLALSTTKSKIADAMGDNAKVLGGLGSAGISAFSAFLNIMKAASPMILNLTDSISKFFASMDLNSAKNQTGLTKFFNNALKVGKEVYSWTKNVIGGLMGMGHASLGLANAMGISFLGSAEKFNKWANGAKGQRTLVNFFNDMKAPLYATGHLFKQLGVAFLDIGKNKKFTDTINAIADQLLPAIVTIMKSINSTNFITGLTTLFLGLATFATKTDLFGHLGDVLKVIGSVFGGIGMVLSHMPKSIDVFIGWLTTISLFTLKFKVARTAVMGLIDLMGKNYIMRMGFRELEANAAFATMKSTLAGMGLKFLGAAGWTMAIAMVLKWGTNAIENAAKKKHPNETLTPDTIKGNGFWQKVGRFGLALDPVSAITDYLFGGDTKNPKKPSGMFSKSGINPLLSGTTHDLLQTKGVKATTITAGNIILTNASNTLNKKPGMFAGGSVIGGKGYTVGELGMEAFISRSGKMSMIGVSGQEDRVFNESGTIIPNHLLDSISLVSRNNLNMTKSLRSGMHNIPVSKMDYDGGQNVFQFGDIIVHQAQEFDVVSAVQKGIEKAQQNSRERR